MADLVLELAIPGGSGSFQPLCKFSESQSIVGILTLNWASDSFTEIVSKIKSLLDQLKSATLWTPGHATIEGNDIAGRLAKDAAQ